MNRLATWATCAFVKVVPVIPSVVYLIYPSLGCVMRPVCHFKVGPWLMLVLLAKSNIFHLNSQTHECNQSKLDFCLTVHHQLGKVIQMNQLDATMIFWSIRSAQHVLGNLLPIIRSVRLRFLQHMVSCKDGYTESYVVLYVICHHNY